MIDLEKGSDKLDKASTFLDKLKALLKRHWGILTLLLVGYFFYWALTTEVEEPAYIEDAYVVDEYLEVDGIDTLLIEVWSDGTETISEY